MADLSTLGARSVGVWTRGDALHLLPRGEIDAFVRARTWQVLWRGVYIDGGFTASAEQRALAAVLATGGAKQPLHVGRPDPETGKRRRVLRAVAAGRTAARVWQLPLIDDADPATGATEHLLDDVAVDRSLPRQWYGGRILRPRKVPLHRSDLVRMPSGLWLTTPLRTLVDCASLLTRQALVCAVDNALHRGLVRHADLDQAAERRRGLPGGAALRTVVTLADGRAESPGETLARLLLLPVLPGLDPQVELFDQAARLVARFDLGDRDVRLGVECDGKRNHAGAHMVAKDRRRDRRAEALGWTTERVTWFELRRQQHDVVRRIVQRHAQLQARRSTRLA